MLYGLMLRGLAAGGFFPAAEAQPAPKQLLRLGAHLSVECMACHRAGGAAGMPVIVGLEPERFLKALREYRDGVRANPAMVSVARSLSEEEMRALAAYFGGAAASREPPPRRRP